MDIQSLTIPVSWSIATEYLRLADQDLVLRETHPGGGQYDCLDVVPVPTGQAPSGPVTPPMTVNRGGSIHLAGPAPALASQEWVQVRDRDELREFVTHLLHASGVGALPRARQTNRRLLGYRLISSVIATRALTGAPWDAHAALYDASDSEPSVVPGAVRGFPGVGSAPSYDVWLLGPISVPRHERIRLHNGYAVNRHDEVLDLHHRYRDTGADIENLTGQLLTFL